MTPIVKHTILHAIALCAILSSTPSLAENATTQVVPAPPAGKGEVVFFRSGTLIGGAISCAVHENGAKVSSLPPGHYFVLAAEPGKHAYSVKSEATDTLNVQVESGEVQYVSCHVKMGIVAGRPVLGPASEADFKAKSLKEVDASKIAPAASAPTAPATPASPAQ